MKLLIFLSNTIIPLLIFYIVGTGLLQKQNIYEQFIHAFSQLQSQISSMGIRLPSLKSSTRSQASTRLTVLESVI